MDAVKSTIGSLTGDGQSTKDLQAEQQQPASHEEKLNKAATEGNVSGGKDGSSTQQPDPAVDTAHPEQISDFLRQQYKSAPVEDTKK